MRNNPSLRMIEIVAGGLRELLDEVVFVGGATTGLYIDDESASPPRATDDVDCTAEITNSKDFRALERKLEKLGFTHAMEPNSPICRWKYGGISVDVMPTDPSILGFTNCWYEEAIKSSEKMQLPHGTNVKVFTLNYFLASKMEAFLNRGQKDIRLSTDLEDMISVLDGCRDLENKLKDGSPEVHRYLKEQFTEFLRSPQILNAIQGNLPREDRKNVRYEKLIGFLTRYIQVQAALP